VSLAALLIPANAELADTLQTVGARQLLAQGAKLYTNGQRSELRLTPRRGWMAMCGAAVKPAPGSRA
jgi:hypothetical protein